jgi:peptide/nickel transport system permease protein
MGLRRIYAEWALSHIHPGWMRGVAVAHAVGVFSKRKPVGAAGAFVVVAMSLAALLAPVISPYDPYEIHAYSIEVAPGGDFLLGTDEFGRDVLSRLLHGARISLYVGLGSVFVGVTAGFLVGIISGYVGGFFDLMVQRLVDALLAFPGIILALALMAVLGSSANNVILALSIVLTPLTSRTARSQVLSLKEMDYITASRAIGAPSSRIVFWHIAPNIFPIYIIMATITIGFAIIAEASLSFLGVGVPIDTPSWGGMLTGAADKYIRSAPWVALAPGVTIAVTVFAFNLLGDGLRDVLDPRLKSA